MTARCLLVLLLWPALLWAKDYTGLDCVCGDRLVQSWTMPYWGNISCPTNHGLELGSNVILDGSGNVFIGAGGDYGIYASGCVNCWVKDLHLTNYQKNIGFRAGASHGGYYGNYPWSWGGLQYNVEVSDGAHDILIQTIQMTASHDESVHVGGGAYNNVIMSNISYDSGKEGFYAINNTGTRFLYNYCANPGGGASCIYLKDAAHGEVTGNDAHSIQLRDAAHHNGLYSNYMHPGRLAVIGTLNLGAFPYSNYGYGNTINRGSNAPCLLFSYANSNLFEASTLLCGTPDVQCSMYGANTVIGSLNPMTTATDGTCAIVVQ